jgi:hypothetical protein
MAASIYDGSSSISLHHVIRYFYGIIYVIILVPVLPVLLQSLSFHNLFQKPVFAFHLYGFLWLGLLVLFTSLFSEAISCSNEH